MKRMIVGASLFYNALYIHALEGDLVDRLLCSRLGVRAFPKGTLEGVRSVQASEKHASETHRTSSGVLKPSS